MAIKAYKGRFVTEYYPKKASTAMAVDELVYIDSNGYVAPATDAGIIVLGQIQKAIAATDSDYASNTLVPVLVPGDQNCEYLCDVTTGTAATTNIGEWVDLDGAGTPSKNLDVSSSTYDIFLVTSIISTSKVTAKLSVKSGVAA